jgi:hypothetical protein
VILSGHLVDSSGAVAVGTTVTIEASALKTTVDAVGDFMFGGLPLGPHTLLFEDLAATGGR